VPSIRKFYQCGLQELNYERKYDCIWLQFCAMYLTDADLMEFLKKTRHHLNTSEELSPLGEKSGLVFVKENV